MCDRTYIRACFSRPSPLVINDAVSDQSDEDALFKDRFGGGAVFGHLPSTAESPLLAPTRAAQLHLSAQANAQTAPSASVHLRLN